MEGAAGSVLREVFGALPPSLGLALLAGVQYLTVRWIYGHFMGRDSALRADVEARHAALAADLRPQIHAAATRVETLVRDLGLIRDRVGAIEFEFRSILGEVRELATDAKDAGGRIERRLEHQNVLLAKLDKKLAVATTRLNRIEYPSIPHPLRDDLADEDA